MNAAVPLAARVGAPARAGFSLLEVLLALIIVALVMAAIGPALVGALRAQRQVRTVLEPLAAEQAAIAVLRDDLLGAPKPDGTLCQPFTVVAGQVESFSAATLQVTTDGAPPLHPRLATRAPEVGQAVVTWAAQKSADGNGLAWTRSRQPHLLATGTAPTPVAEVLLDHLALITIEAWTAGAFSTAYDSSQLDSVLPLAVRVTWAYADSDGQPGPRHVAVLDLPQVALDPVQAGD